MKLNTTITFAIMNISYSEPPSPRGGRLHGDGSIQNKGGQGNNGIDIDSLYESQIVTQIASHQNLANPTITKSNIVKDGDDLITIYPNPARYKITLTKSLLEDGQFVLYNTLGQKIVVKFIEKQDVNSKIELGNLASGVYQYELLFTSGKKYHGKLTIQN